MFKLPYVRRNYKGVSVVSTAQVLSTLNSPCRTPQGIPKVDMSISQANFGTMFRLPLGRPVRFLMSCFVVSGGRPSLTNFRFRVGFS